MLGRRYAGLAIGLCAIYAAGCSDDDTAGSTGGTSGTAGGGTGSGGSPGCVDPAETLCEGECVALDSDAQNCGQCGRACLGAPCFAGAEGTDYMACDRVTLAA